MQLTLTTFFVGMALGQLIGGPVSDARGRRGPLLLALIVLTLASIACAFSPSITRDDDRAFRAGPVRWLGDGHRPGGHRGSDRAARNWSAA